MKSEKTLSNKLIRKLILTFLCIIIAMGTVYVLTTLHFSQKFYNETSQKLNANVASHLVDEKFKETSPFLKNGEVNKPLFGDLMHDMMAVNRAIEVYLLNEKGGILYSVVLDHSDSEKPLKKVDLKPIKEFITKERTHVLGEDPRNPGTKKIFSAASFEKNGRKGYIYVILAGETFEKINESLLSYYFLTFAIGSSIITMIFSFLIGWLCIHFLTRNLRSIIFHVNCFSEGDLSSRIENAEKSNLSSLAITFNNMADAISKSIKEMKSIDTIRRELIANVSHDLRTPLTTMCGYIETLQMKENSINALDRKEYIKIIEKSTNHLRKLVSQLFEYSKLEAKQMKPVIKPFFITDLIKDIKERYSLLALEKEIVLSVFIEDETLLAIGDVDLIERAILNILDNAIKFTPVRGRIKLGLFKENTNVKVRIEDTGQGIKEEDKDLIFKRFHQSETIYKKNGVGLGLAIVKKIMELHKTQINVESNLNEGSTFEFYLPSYVKLTVNEKLNLCIEN